MSDTILFVVNPISGGIDKQPLLEKIKSHAQSSGYEPEIMETTGENDEERIREAVKKYQPKKVVAAGGDGTVLLCASLLKDTDIPLGIIPSGSANGMCSELQIPADLDQALKIIENGNVERIDMLVFNEDHLSMHISDIGLNARLVKNFEESENRGFLGYAKGVIGELIGTQPFDVTLKTKKDTIKHSSYMVAFANARRYGTGALLNSIGKLDDGLFEVCILKELNLANIAGQFFDFVNKDSEYMEVIQCEELEVKADREVSFQIDGELQNDVSKLTVSIHPKCINVIRPHAPERQRV